MNVSFEISTKLLIHQRIQSHSSNLSLKVFFVHGVGVNVNTGPEGSDKIHNMVASQFL
jgi:hypothetical protein